MTSERKKELREMAESELNSGGAEGFYSKILVELLDALKEADEKIVFLMCGK